MTMRIFTAFVVVAAVTLGTPAFVQGLSSSKKAAGR
jgi:hypothetical protein